MVSTFSLHKHDVQVCEHGVSMVTVTFLIGRASFLTFERWRVRWIATAFDLCSQGVYLKKKLTGGLGLFFGSKIFDILIFWVGKISLIFWVWRFFTYFFWNNNFDAIYFLGVRLNDLDLQNRSNNNINEDRSTWPNDSSPDSWNLLRKWMTESLDELHRLQKGLIF